MIDLTSIPTGSTWSGTISRDEAGRLHIAGTLETAPKAANEEPLDNPPDEPVITWPAPVCEKAADFFEQAPDLLTPTLVSHPAVLVSDATRKKQSEANSGTGNPRARLTESNVKFIRSSREKASDLARAFGVTPGTIYDIRLARSWKSLP